MRSGLIVAWCVGEGDAVREGDDLVEITTTKATNVLAAERDGVLLRILAPAGAELAVGAPLAVLGEAGDCVKDMDQLTAGLGETA